MLNRLSSRLELANAIRALSMDAVQEARSGHPGMPMGMADIAEVLWNDYLRHNPQDPAWPNRDRFIVSNGHGSMLLFSLLHLTGYNLSIDDLKQFRQWHSKTPGHPEYGDTPGVETSTGPLGQGLSNAVGMAIAEKHLAATFNRPNFPIVDHYTYVFLGDGCLMEGISHEACSFAGTMKLGKLICFYDDNGISIDGETEGWFTDDTPKRFAAYGWHVVPNVNGHDPAQIKDAIELARGETERPTLICCKTLIGWGAPNASGKETCHGSPLGDQEILLTRQALNWPHEKFVVPTDVYNGWDAREEGEEAQKEWSHLFSNYQKAFPDLAEEYSRRLSNKLPNNWEAIYKEVLDQFKNEKTLATRQASQLCLNVLGKNLPELLGGSADLTSSNNTEWENAEAFSAEHPSGRYFHYGVREFGMSGIMNGLALHGGIIPYGGTFLVFLDYARNAIRMAALMRQRVIFVYSHDSIGLGEDGPTHQPIEHIGMLRLTPNVSLWRPADGVETAVAWKAALERQDAPTCLLLSRQTLPHYSRETTVLDNIQRGGYVLRDCKGTPEIILIATGSEVALAVEAYDLLIKECAVRVVSMPSTDIFDQQSDAYRESVLPAAVTGRVAIEAGSADIWYKYVGLSGRIIGMHRFGASAPAKVLFKAFGFTIENVLNTVNELRSK